MANELTTTLGTELIMSQAIETLLYQAAYSAGIVSPWVRFISLVGKPTNTAEVPKWPLLSALSLTEGTDMANTPLNPTSVNVTAAESGLMITLTDLFVNADVLGGIPAFIGQLGLAMRTKIDSDLASDFASFTNSVGTTAVGITETNFHEAIYTLENGNAPGTPVCFLHPFQMKGLRIDISSSAGAIWGASAGPNALVMKAGSFYGVPTFTSTNVPTANAAVDRCGAMFPEGENSGICYVEKKEPSMELQRDASLRGTEVVGTAVYGHSCANTAANGGVKIVTSAS